MPTERPAAVLLMGLITGCVRQAPHHDTGTGLELFTAAEQAMILGLSPLATVSPDPTNRVADDPAAAWLGRYFFFDTGLSSTGEHSCDTCHQPAHGFADPEVLSEALGTTGRHTPTVLNTVTNDWFFWDGRADSHWAQALGPIEDPDEQGSTRTDVAHRIAQDPELLAAWEDVFGTFPDISDTSRFPPGARPVPAEVTHEHNLIWLEMSAEDQDTINRIYSDLGKAIAAYERLLVQGNSPFDTYVAGLRSNDSTQQEALSESARRGLKLYVGEGRCHFCHSGSNFTNNAFHNIGLAPEAHLDAFDTGRYDGIDLVQDDIFNATGSYSDDPEGASSGLEHLVRGDEQLGQYKTPSLRNLLTTAPYMHGGQLASLTEVVEHYVDMDDTPAWGHTEDLLLPLDWDEEEIADMVAFLESLEGEPIDPALTTPPNSPRYSP